MNDSGPSLRKRRKKARIGLREMARHLGISHAYLRDMERGNRPLRQDLAMKMQAAVVNLKKPNARVVA
jgi:transcriptional regulator with XRE-family HTH domain